MKNLFLVLIVLSVCACNTDRLNMQSAVSTAEHAVKHIGNKEFSELFKLYSKDFAASETEDIRKQKLGKIIDAVGAVQEVTLLDTIRVENSGEEPSIVIKYKVKHVNTVTTETFTVIFDEGQYLLSDVNITNQ
jgi:hypothetical protein